MENLSLHISLLMEQVFAPIRSKQKTPHAPMIDMTPMVDLGFLLIAFFVFTTTLSETTTMKLIMPIHDPGEDPSLLQESMALTFMLDDENKVYYYHGDPNKALQSSDLHLTNYSNNGIGAVIREKQLTVDQHFPNLGGRNRMMVLIKPTNMATYQNTVDVLDEMLVNDVKRYAIVDILPIEKNAIEKQSQKN